MGSPKFAIISKASSDFFRFNASDTILFFKSKGLFCILELTLHSNPNALKTVSAVVVPPGIHSPITRQSVFCDMILPKFFPYSIPDFTCSIDIAGDSEIFFPGSISASK